MEIAKFPTYQLENSSGVEIDDEEDGRFYKYWGNEPSWDDVCLKRHFLTVIIPNNTEWIGEKKWLAN